MMLNVGGTNPSKECLGKLKENFKTRMEPSRNQASYLVRTWGGSPDRFGAELSNTAYDRVLKHYFRCRSSIYYRHLALLFQWHWKYLLS